MKPLLNARVVVSVLAVAEMLMGVLGLHAQTSTPVLYPVGPQVLTIGMVGLAPGQTARLSALNVPGFQEIHTLPCNMTLSFMDDQGATLKTANMNIDSGKAGHLDLARNEVNGDSSRLQIRGVILQVVTPGLDAAPGILVPWGCSVSPTLEIFDSASGITRVVLESAKGVPTILPLMGGAASSRP